MKHYWLVRLGKANVFAKDGHEGGYIGVDFLGNIDLKDKLFEDWREFNRDMIPVWLEKHPGRSKVAAGLACGNLWTVIKGIAIGDVVLCPLGNSNYAVGEVAGPYEFHSGKELPHRRPVRWFATLAKDAMSEGLQNSAGSIMTAFSLDKYQIELDRITGEQRTVITTNDEAVEDPATFALEKHLEDFLVQNWKLTELGKKYDIYESEGEVIGQQYPSDTGPIDILAISKDKKELLVIELKKGRVSDVVVGQIQRYMGYVKEELAEEGQSVKGLIISSADDLRLRRALSVTSNIELMLYEVSFKLKKSAH